MWNGKLACLLAIRGNPLCPYLSAFMRKSVVNEMIAVSGETMSHLLSVQSPSRNEGGSREMDGNYVKHKISSLVESHLFIGFLSLRQDSKIFKSSRCLGWTKWSDAILSGYKTKHETRDRRTLVTFRSSTNLRLENNPVTFIQNVSKCIKELAQRNMFVAGLW